MKLFALFLSVLCLVCAVGCSSGTDILSVELSTADYAEKYLEYADAESAEFYLAGEQSELKVGQSIGGFTLQKLQTRDDGGTTAVRAVFSCKQDVTGTLACKKDSAYGSIVYFYPDANTLFPQPLGTVAKDSWLVVLEDNSPLDIPGLFGDGTGEVHITVKTVSYTVHTTVHNTVRYIKITTE